ncbi:MAG: hypothetical protein AB7T49_08190 [Oligoflexales bacterium]
MKLLSLFFISTLVLSSCSNKDNNSKVAGVSDSTINRLVEDQFNKVHYDEPIDTDGFTAAEIEELYATTLNHPVAKPSRVPDYDPAGQIGFCFGRSTTALLVARKMALNPESIKKLFIVGDLHAPGRPTEWRFHTTTIVKRDDGQWIAIDPIMNQSLTAIQWIKKVRYYWDRWYLDDANFDKPQAKIYLTPFDAVLPDIRTFTANGTGENLIDLNFDPEGREGFTRRPDLQRSGVDELAYELNKKASDKYFLSHNENPESDSFNYIGLEVVNTAYLAYKGYFVDLLQTFEEGTWKSDGETGPTALTGGTSIVDPEEGPSSVFSFRLDKLLAE